ncbi:MAG: 30S ribosomal protein S8 [Enterobacteriaceae bacterium]
MNIQDPVSDMITCIRNAQKARIKSIIVSYSSFKFKILKILKEEGFLKKINIFKKNNKSFLHVKMRYFKNLPVIEEIKRISKPSLRVYKNFFMINKIRSNMGVYIISTSKGVMTDKKAKKLGLGGEIICYVF